MNKVYINLRRAGLLALLMLAPASVFAKDTVAGDMPASTRPCFIVVNEKTVFDGSKVTSIGIEDNNITSRNVVVHFGMQTIEIGVVDEAAAIKYLADLVTVIQKSCK